MNAFRNTLERMLDALAYANAGNQREVMELLARRSRRFRTATTLVGKADSICDFTAGLAKPPAPAKIGYGSEPVHR